MSAIVAPTSTDRLLAGMRSIIRRQFPTFLFSGMWEYTIVAATSTTIDAAPLDPTSPLPSIRGVTFKPSLLGEGVTPSLGGVCVIAFINQDPTRPRVISIDSVPISATVDATAQLALGPSAAQVQIAGASGLPAARTTDAVIAGPFGGTIVGGSVKTTVG